MNSEKTAELDTNKPLLETPAAMPTSADQMRTLQESELLWVGGGSGTVIF